MYLNTIRICSSLSNRRTSVECSDNIQSLNIFPGRDKFESYMRRTGGGNGPHRLSDSGLFQSQKAKAKASAPMVSAAMLSQFHRLIFVI